VNEIALTEMIPRLLMSMGLVIVVMVVAARLLQNRRIPGTGGMRFGTAPTAEKRTELEIVSRQGVGRHAALAVVRVEGTSFVVGITDQQVNLVTVLGNDKAAADTNSEFQALDAQWTDIEAELAIAQASSTTRTGLLSQVRERTVRH
jgi:flagellar biogenesis protein FliO